jgi:putative mRNA 3-end processing factor
VNIETVEYGETRTINGVDFSFHPAGHILGSAQIRVAFKGEVWVVSGDYKLEDDGLSGAFEPLRCHAFITESTFGLPVYRWKPQAEVFREINTWWRDNQAQDKVSVITAYALGKAQRILQGIDTTIGPIFTHGAIENVNEVIRAQGVGLPDTRRVNPDTRGKGYSGGLVIAPPAVIGSLWLRQFREISLGVASGWMTLRGARRRKNADRGFVLSDHADWNGLNAAVSATGAEKIIATHGYSEHFSQWLRQQGLEAVAEKTAYEGELLDPSQTGEGEKEE